MNPPFRNINGLWFREVTPGALLLPVAGGAGTYSVIESNALMDNFASRALFGALHSAYPSDAGSNEISGGTPAYARKSLVPWNAAAGGSTSVVTPPTFDVPAGQLISWLGVWSLVTAGTFRARAPLGGGVPMPFEQRASDETITADQHGLTDGTRVVVFDTTNAVLPTPLVEGTIYFVIASTTDTFQLSATSGGSAINITVDGAGFLQTIVPEQPGGQATYSPTSVSFDLLR